MFNSLLANTTPQVPQGYAVSDNTLRTRLSLGVPADLNHEYIGHVDIPPSALSGLSTDWRARLSVMYEVGVLNASGDLTASTTGNSTRAGRFHMRIGRADPTVDPTDLNTTNNMADPAIGTGTQGGQASAVVMAAGGSMGSEIYCTTMWNTQGEYLSHPTPLSRWCEPFASAGLRFVTSFAWSGAAVPGLVMRVLSVSIELIPGKAKALVTPGAPRTLTLQHFGGHWAGWPTTVASAAVAPLGQNVGSVRFFADWPNIETTNWSGLTDAQCYADPGWARMDEFVNGHSAVAGRQMLICLNTTAAPYNGGNILNPPSDLAAGAASSWSKFCRLVATRYANKGIWYESWNEPNVTGTPYVGFTGTASQLATVHSQAATAIRAVDPTAKILTPAFATVIRRGLNDGVGYVHAALTANGGVMRTSSDYFNHHAYDIHGSLDPYTSVAYISNARAILTRLGSPTMPIVMSETSTGAPNWLDISPPARRAYMARSTIGGLLCDPYTKTFMFYGLNQTNHGWDQGDVDFWNNMVAFLISGPITSATINPDGSVSVVIGATSRIY